jgi:hypothetical protein
MGVNSTAIYSRSGGNTLVLALPFFLLIQFVEVLVNQIIRKWQGRSSDLAFMCG